MQLANLSRADQHDYHHHYPMFLLLVVLQSPLFHHSACAQLIYDGPSSGSSLHADSVVMMTCSTHSVVMMTYSTHSVVMMTSTHGVVMMTYSTHGVVMMTYSTHNDIHNSEWFVMGPAGSGSCLHVNPLATSAWNALLVAHKRWVLFPPGTPCHHGLPKLPGLEQEAVSWFTHMYPRTQRDHWPTAKPINDIQVTAANIPCGAVCISCFDQLLWASQMEQWL